MREARSEWAAALNRCAGLMADLGIATKKNLVYA